jgi:signal transduction histidine kinase
VAISLVQRPGAAEHSQAVLFVDVPHKPSAAGSRFWRGSASVADLSALLGRFLGPERAQQALASFASAQGVAGIDALSADAALVHHVETLLAGAIGSASARVMVSSVVEEEPLGLDEVLGIVDEASQVLAYSRQLEQKSRELETATNELREANQRLQELDRLKDDFMSTVTHELRTPLTSIRAFSEILRDNPELEPAQRTRFLEIIIKESERLTRLINQVLDLAKIESMNAEWHDTEVDLREIVTDSLVATSQLLEDRSIEVETDLQPVPTIRADRDRLIQVMLNLVSNAAKFCDRDHGRIGIRLRHDARAIRVDVRDNGPGISPDNQKVIFEKFRQVGDTLTDKPQGSGLGLPISRRIINHFGGELWVESAVGKGATFSFTLPLAAAERSRPVVAAESPVSR